MNLGIIHNQIQMIDPKSGHRGYDIRVKPGSSRKGALVELNDFEFINNGTRMGSPSYNQEKVKELFDTVVTKYFYQNRKGQEAAKEQVSNIQKQEIRTDIPNGKVLKAIVQTVDGEYEVRTNGEATPEMNKIVNTLMTAHATAQFAMRKQIYDISEKLRVGTLDVSEDGKSLVIWNKDGTTSPVTGKVSLNTLKASLWFLSGMYKNAPSIRKYFGTTVTEGKYTLSYTNGILKFETKGLSQLEIDIINDIKQLDRA